MLCTSDIVTYCRPDPGYVGIPLSYQASVVTASVPARAWFAAYIQDGYSSQGITVDVWRSAAVEAHPGHVEGGLTAWHESVASNRALQYSWHSR